MTRRPDHQQLTEWSEAVARDPVSLLFLPLATEYRERGLRDAAIRLCLRGLDRHPNHVEAHHLLGTLYHDAGDLTRAFDEWDIVLRLDPAHLEARQLLESLPAAAGPGPGRGEFPLPGDPPEHTTARAVEAVHSPFAAMWPPDGIRGAVLLDGAGRLIGGEMQVEGVDHAPAVAAALGDLAGEAARATEYLGLGSWREMVLEAGPDTMVVAPAGGATAAVLADPGVQLGRLARMAKKLCNAAGDWLATQENSAAV